MLILIRLIVVDIFVRICIWIQKTSCASIDEANLGLIRALVDHNKLILVMSDFGCQNLSTDLDWQ